MQTERRSPQPGIAPAAIKEVVQASTRIYMDTLLLNDLLGLPLGQKMADEAVTRAFKDWIDLHPMPTLVSKEDLCQGN